MTTLICDTETDGLLPDMTRLWCVQIGDADTDEVTIYADQPGFPPLVDAVARMAAAEFTVWHNSTGFDFHVIERFYPGTLQREKVIDTLVLARLSDPEERDHSLKAWGRRLDVAKGAYTGDFQSFTEELVVYARQDIVVGRALYNKVKHVLQWGESAKLEQEVAWAIWAQEQHGFLLDVPAAEQLDLRLRAKLDEVNRELQAVFPPLARESTRIMQASNKKLGYVKGQPFTKTWTETFNPGSRKQTAERLIALGWKPKKFGADGVPSVDEAVLSAMRHPVSKVLLRYFETQKQLGMLSDGKAGWLKLVQKDGRIHGRVNPNGARTGRMTHFKPNTAQVDKDPAMRSLWRVAEGHRLVGCDGEGIQLRVLASYLHKYDGGQLAERIVSGNKKDRTDAHSANLKALVEAGVLAKVFWDDTAELKDAHTGFHFGRDGAKTTIYAKLFGSTDAGLGRTTLEIYAEAGVTPPRLPKMELGRMANTALSRAMVGLDKLEATAGAKIKQRGYLFGMDGRRIYSKQARLALVSLCQGGEAAIMKKALAIWHFEVSVAEGFEHGVHFGYCANVHDEVQIEVYDPDLAEHVGRRFAGCITEAGVRLGFKCPLSGSYDIGMNWAETH